MVRSDVTVTAGGDIVAELMIVMALFAASYVHLERGPTAEEVCWPVQVSFNLLSTVDTALGYTDLSIRRWKTIFFIYLFL
jgi:hypothetical protein